MKGVEKKQGTCIKMLLHQNSSLYVLFGLIFLKKFIQYYR